MTSKEIYKQELIKIYEDQHQSMESTINYVFTHYNKLPMTFVSARKELTDSEKNDVIRDVCYPF
ncbi:hypothetical protein [Companilactobacillus paralimentarius]|uniref:hypothetical protein n=1 Tax=Companilactobacillus paralimentarius TaxID=83526 RepID=UPI00384B8633